MHALLVAVLLFAGCGSDAPPVRDAGIVDLDAPDVASSTVKTGCRGYVQCILDCGNDLQCRGMCMQNVTSTDATRLFADALACGQDWCLGVGDLGTGDCILLNGTLTDAPGRMTCVACRQNAFALLFGIQCMPDDTDKNCNPTPCRARYQACLASTP